MNYLEDFKKFLPQFLFGESKEKLFEELKCFPNNIDQRIFSSFSESNNGIFQGDGLKQFKLADYEQDSFFLAKVIVVSNTCDVSVKNKRYFEACISVAPIFNLKKYRVLLRENYPETKWDAIDNHIRDIKSQFVSQIFYLPSKEPTVPDESFVRLDMIQSLPLSIIDLDKINDIRIFSISNYGFYLFLYKLSVHFCRVRESIDRN